MNTDIAIKDLTDILFFLIAVLVLYMSAGKKATYYFLLLVLFGVIATHITQIKSLTK